MFRLTLFGLGMLLLHAQCTTRNAEYAKGDQTDANQLIQSSSPYLLQHAYNPVNWYPWGQEALARAQKENKMLLISVGYSACHWCHVMAHESFEDTAVARIMNTHFINIKVDREERPDVDDVYMSACQIATGRACGWPLNAFALPDGRPVWAGTYYPRKEWIKVLQYFIELHHTAPDKLDQYADRLTAGIRAEHTILEMAEGPFSRDQLKTIAQRFIANLDPDYGGDRGAPKFPMPNQYQFLLQYAHCAKAPQAMDAVTVALDNIARGGIYDHIGGGFARYSVDPEWHIPHFEKMLYDNAQLIMLYAQAWQKTHYPRYQDVIEHTLQFIDRTLSDPGGGFYASLDADSEGEEGKYYVWKASEIDALIKDETTNALFRAYYDIRDAGNWEDEKNVLRIRQDPGQIARDFQMTDEELRQRLGNARQILLEARNRRTRPGLDDKILTSWNALMIMGYLEAATALNRPAYLERAKRCADFIKQNMVHEDGRLDRNYKDGVSSINGFLDDYAFLASALIKLYQVTFEEDWLNLAKDLTDYTLEHFYDPVSGMFFYTSKLDPPLVARKQVLEDNVIPGSNSAMAHVLFQLGTYFYEPVYAGLAKEMLRRMLPVITEAEQPNFYSNWCQLYLDVVWPPYEIAIVGPGARYVSFQMQSEYLPQTLFLGGTDAGTLQLLKGKHSTGETIIYVCQDKICKLPVTSIEAAREQMRY